MKDTLLGVIGITLMMLIVVFGLGTLIGYIAQGPTDFIYRGAQVVEFLLMCFVAFCIFVAVSSSDGGSST